MDSQSDNSKTTISVKATNKLKINSDAAQISIREFLNFLKTAYQVQDSVEGILLSGGMTEAVNWLKCKENQIALKKNSSYSQTSDTNLSNESGDDKNVNSKRSLTNVSDSELLKRQLGEVLSEGLLDSVLPYLVQNAKNSSRKNSVIKMFDKPIHSSQSIHSSNERIAGRRRSSAPQLSQSKQSQRLEDMDISVHCDIGIFEWLMQWVKRESLLEEDWPELDPQCVIPILVSAAFLQMEPLLNDCLFFCHEHMNEILRTNTNLSCLNDSVLTRLAAMYTNIEVEAIKDRKDKIQSRLFSKLIQSLAEPEPESLRGHWCSMARVFRCEKCQQFITPEVAEKIPCIPPCMRLEPDGTITSLHIKDPAWNINDYIVKLHKTLKTWRKVYWRLWGDSHFLFCVCTQGVRDSTIFTMLETFRHIVEEEPPQLLFPERLTRLVARGK
ncbi:hypothetical protein NQ314_013813 [Rhamnusium bicolor]|uniref:SANT and BTB domain-containing protein n=1 Tax=Rhamnusium bicolor TaxID=1586634 RepID=A0AAV8X746_9CUCU|nr:hypothetical protein NQ314_013813 [Rhamnusium bicolor]